jgi:YbbR domain-containing protein
VQIKKESYQKNMIKKAIKNNLAFKITAIVLAILLWFYVFYVFGAKTTKTAQIQIQVEGLNSSYEVILSQPSINVTFSAPIQQIEQLEKNIRVRMDLSNIGPGSYQREPELIYPKGVEIISLDPTAVEVKVENIVMKDFVIEAISKGKLKPGTLLGEISLTPDKVSIQGTKDILATIASVIIEIDVSTAVSDLSGAAEIKVLTKNRELVENISVSTKVIKFQIPIITSDITKTVPIIPNFIGTSSGAIQSFSIQPQVITLRGTVASLEKIQSIFTVPIDLSQINQTITKEIEIILPEGIRRENTTEKIRMTLQVEDMISKTFSSVKIIARNSSFKNFTLSQEFCTVLITGRKSLVEKVSSLEAWVDLKNAVRGLNELNLMIKDIPPGLLVQFTPSKIEVKIID